jgi:hypothetical protein
MKFKIAFVLLVAFPVLSSFAQKLISKNAHIWFYSHTAMEDIEAHNRQVVSILDISTGDLQFNLLVKSFEFKNALMQVHFNENYMESDKIPKASFKGIVMNIDKIDFKKDGTYPVDIKGTVTIHGVSKPLNTAGTIEIKGGIASGHAKFQLVPKDFDIKIPSLVENKIAKEMEVTVELTYSDKI